MDTRSPSGPQSYLGRATWIDNWKVLSEEPCHHPKQRNETVDWKLTGENLLCAVYQGFWLGCPNIRMQNKNTGNHRGHNHLGKQPYRLKDFQRQDWIMPDLFKWHGNLCSLSIDNHFTQPTVVRPKIVLQEAIQKMGNVLENLRFALFAPC